MDKEVINKITKDDLPGDMRDMAEIIGVKYTIMLMEKYAGMQVSFPSRGLLEASKRYIIENYDGTTESRRKLIRDCGISESYFYKITKEMRTPKKVQLKLFS